MVYVCVCVCGFDHRIGTLLYDTAENIALRQGMEEKEREEEKEDKEPQVIHRCISCLQPLDTRVSTKCQDCINDEEELRVKQANRRRRFQDEEEKEIAAAHPKKRAKIEDD